MNQKIIIHIDPSIGSTNLGDEIISDAVAKVIEKAFPDSRVLRFSSRDVGVWASGVFNEADYIIFGGSNALSSNPVFGYRQFSMGFLNAFNLKNVILMGVGWWQYQKIFGPFSKILYKKMLRGDCLHSVRDDYTKRKLRQLGFNNVLNTACPTMWELDSFNTVISDTVILTLTDYNKNEIRDCSILRNALKKFKNVFLWPQGLNDLSYLQRFAKYVDLSRIEIINPSLSDFDKILSGKPCYVGTRLHAGIRALQFKCPAFIVPIDNRAVEIAKTESLSLIDPEMAGVLLGDEFRFKHTRRSEVDQYLVQFKGLA